MLLNLKCNSQVVTLITEHVRKPWLGSECQSWVQITQPLSELQFPHLQNGIMSDAFLTVLLWAVDEVMCGGSSHCPAHYEQRWPNCSSTMNG